MKNILEVKNLKVLFADTLNPKAEAFAAVNDVSLEIAEGSFTSIVGESGSGKSVTALSISRLIRPLSITGKIYFSSGRFQEKNLLTVSEGELEKLRGGEVAYIFQDPSSSLNPVIRIGPQIVEAYRAHFKVDSGSATLRAKEFLSRVKISDIERVYNSFPHELSGGMKQRAMIAMALISDPKLLIADEPTTALDVKTELEIIELLLEIQKERQLTVLFITHDLSLAVRYSENIFVMRKGLMVEKLARGEAGFKPLQDYTRRLFGAKLGMSIPKTRIEAL